MYPLIRAGVSSAYLSIDPDIVYLANSLSYIKYNVIAYHDHPGALAIFLISLFMIPLRVLTSGDFIKYVFENLTFVLLYIRFLQSILLAFGLFIYSYSIKKLSKNLFIPILPLLMFLSFTPIYFLSSSISAETLSFVFGSLWILFFTLYLNNKKNDLYIYVISFISGVVFANRATFIVYLLSTLIILMKDVKRFKKGVFVILSGFIVGILPSIDKILLILKRVIFFASSSGVHGDGAGFLFNMNYYLNSVLIYLQRDWGLVTALLLAIIILFLTKYKTDNDVYILGIVTIVLIIIFMKFPLAHYQVANYQCLVFIITYSLTIINFRFSVFLFAVYGIFGVYYFNSYYKNVSNDLSQIKSQNLFFENNPSNMGRVWSWARSEEFSKIWINNASSGMLKEYLSTLNPKIIEYGDKNLFNECWDQLYIQESELNLYKNNYANQKVHVNKIENSQNLYLIRSDHCKPKKL